MKRIQMYTKNMSYPCLKEELLVHATDQGADQTTLGVLESLPVEFFPSHKAVKDCFRTS